MVEEDEYRSTYHALNKRRCVFEKAILSRHCACSLSRRFFLADREGIACSDPAPHQRCKQLLELLRKNARFALQQTDTESELPHGKEIKVQNGGMLGLQRALYPQRTCTEVADIDSIANLGKETFGSFEQLPFQDIVKSIVSFEGRRRPRSKR